MSAAAEEHEQPHWAYNAPAQYIFRLTAREVLDTHADLHRYYSALPAFRREELSLSAAHWEDPDPGVHQPALAAYIHPAAALDDLGPWFASLGNDLFGAATYQVTEEMVRLAAQLEASTPNLGTLMDEDLPCPWGFMWLDLPLFRDDPDRVLRPVHAVSWVRVAHAGRGGPAARLRLWSPAAGSVARWERYYPRLAAHLAEHPGERQLRLSQPRVEVDSQDLVSLRGGGEPPAREMRLIHMLWIMCGMEIVTASPQQPGRAGRKRAANLRFQQVHVVQLRRAASHEPEGGHRHVDWSCSWLVRGHWRKAPHGGTFRDGRDRTWVKPYIKGPDGMPLRASDLLYRLSRLWSASPQWKSAPGAAVPRSASSSPDSPIWPWSSGTRTRSPPCA